MPAAAKKKLAVVEAAPAAVDDARGKLAAAIEAKQRADAAVAAKLGSIRRASDAVQAAEADIEKCKKAIAKARETDSKSAASMLDRGDKPMMPWRTSSAISDVERAEVALEVATGAYQRLKKEMLGLEDDVAEAKNQVTVAVKELTRPLAEQLMDELRQLRLRTSICVRALSDLMSEDARTLPTFHDQMRGFHCASKREAVVAEMKEEASRLLYGGSSADHEAGLEASKKIKAVLAELMQTPRHPLPKV